MCEKVSSLPKYGPYHASRRHSPGTAGNLKFAPRTLDPTHGFLPIHNSHEKFTRTGHRGHTDKQTADNSLGLFGHTTLSSDGDGADLSPADRSHAPPYSQPKRNDPETQRRVFRQAMWRAGHQARADGEYGCPSCAGLLMKCVMAPGCTRDALDTARSS